MAVQNGLTRQELSQFLPNQRAIRAFEETFQAVDTNTTGVETAQQAAEGAQQAADQAQQAADEAVQATNNIIGASILVLSLDGTLTNERVLTAGNLIDFDDTGPNGTLTVKVDKLAIAGAFTLGLTLTANSALTLPASGTLATLAGTETLSAKTLDAPKISGLGNYPDDAAAAAGGVPVGGVYRNGSVLMVRVA